MSKDTVRCPNCGTEHNNAPNYYCGKCSRNLAGIGLFNYIDQRGFKNVQTEPQLIPLKTLVKDLIETLEKEDVTDWKTNRIKNLICQINEELEP